MAKQKLSTHYLICLFLGLIILSSIKLSAQDFASHVNPFIGTEESDVPSIWGKYGGTYPGAVAPWGYVQLSPETSKTGERGYFFNDPSICYFTCINHNSGYPLGSTGNVQIVFTQGTLHTDVTNIRLPLTHDNPKARKGNYNEKAQPGYYHVRFDDGSRVETTTTTRTGMFRYTPIEAPFVVSIADAGEISIVDKNTVEIKRSNGLFVFNQQWDDYKLENGRLTLQFNTLPKEEVLLVKTAFSTVDHDGSRKNMQAECNHWDFDAVKEQTYKEWNEVLKVVEIQEGDSDDLQKFYTALYHSSLIPYIISDVDGRYRGKDKQIHQTEGTYEYGMFSTWDTFRSLHPLLALLRPDRQTDMIRSMLHIYQQAGQLPYTPMTGYHSLPIIADSYMKGITNFDQKVAYEAMRKALIGDGIPRPDTYKYIAAGYLNDSIEESVSVTLDYAYNDWTLARFAESLGKESDAKMLYERSLNYRNLFDHETSFMFPRNDEGFIRNPGEMGYKEANKWTATWFVPHNMQDLINLMGGDQAFTQHLNGAMEAGHIIHDNEPVMQYPYLFSYAGRPDLTSKWVAGIRNTCYSNTAGGITGNDDLGSMSSWLVFSTLGFFPACPAMPEYILNSPMFTNAKVHFAGGRTLNITADKEAQNNAFSNVELDDKALNQLYITHDQLTRGNHLHFTGGTLDDYSRFARPSSLTQGMVSTEITDARLSKDKTVANEEIFVEFTIKNKGARGTKQIVLTDQDGTVVAQKNILTEAGQTTTEKLPFRLYSKGKHSLLLEGIKLSTEVKPSKQKEPIVCLSVASAAVVKQGTPIEISVELQNTSDTKYSGQISLVVDGNTISSLKVDLEPGAKAIVKETINPTKTGIHKISVLDKEHKVRTYDKPLESCVLDINFQQMDEHTAVDQSGFENHGTIHGSTFWAQGGDSFIALEIKETDPSYVSLPASSSLNITGQTVTMSAWVYPTKEDKGYIDFFSKGDNMMLKTGDGQLTFFAGGWGRGECSAQLPDNWLHNWHHVAGVCTGKELKVYINGKLMSTEPIAGENIYETEVPWNIGRNAEMPYSRRYAGMFHGVKIFKDALSDEDVKSLYEKK